VGPRAGLDTEATGKVLSPLLGIKPRFTAQNGKISVWIENQNKRQIPLSLLMIQEKVKILTHTRRKRRVKLRKLCCKSWLVHCFRNCANLLNVKVSGEAASADPVAAEQFPNLFGELIEKSGYLSEQMFNVDRTGLLWKRKPYHTYIAKEKSVLGFQWVKDCHNTLYLGISN
jgi:hypothetical protein